MNDLSMEDIYYIEYFGMKRLMAEEKSRFKALFEGLTKLFQALAKVMRGR